MITIYTSYWAYLTNIPKNKYYIVQVSNTRPKGIRPSEIDAVWPAAMPDYTTMVKAFQDKKIDAKQYSTMYDTILTQRKDQIKNEYKSLYNTAKKLNKELVFICWEKPGNFCHRTQLGNFDQLIWEKGGQWIHVSYKRTGGRTQMLSWNGSKYININSNWENAIA